MRFAELDAVTLDAFGTLIELTDPVPALDRALQERGIKRNAQALAQAFEAEGSYYRAHSLQGRDETSLARLRETCVAVFLEALEADLTPEEFVEPYVAALRFELLPGAREGVRALRRRGLATAVVSNWDMTLPRHLERLGLGAWLDTVVTSAAAGSAKPDPEIFRRALTELAVRPERTLHVGDTEEDERGARAAGLHFAPAPLAAALGAA